MFPGALTDLASLNPNPGALGQVQPERPGQVKTALLTEVVVTQETVDAYLREAQRFGTLRADRDRMVAAMDDEGMRSWNVSIDAHNKTSTWSTRICTEHAKSGDPSYRRSDEA
jgi:hypothetical protein